MYVNIDGQRVAEAVARDFARLRSAFAAAFGLVLLVTSGTRTRVEQQQLRDGYLAGWPGYARALDPDDPLAFHVESNPTGPRALDVRDSGDDAGVTVAGTERSNWLRANAPTYNFVVEGLDFAEVEPWHMKWVGSDPHASAVQAPAFPLPAGSYFGPASGPAESVSGYYSHREDLRYWQQRMKDRGWIINPDGLYGDETASVATAFQQEKGLAVDGLIGPQTWAAAWTAPVS